MPVQYAATFPFITYAGDVLANQPFEGTLDASIKIDTSIVGSGSFGGFSETVSEIAIINAEGLYDTLPDIYSINGQIVTLKLGILGDRLIVDPYNSFVTIAILTAERMSINRTQLQIELRDQAAPLTTETVQQNVYDGTGDINGGEDIAGKRRPKGYGVVFNASPTLVIPNLLIWQFHDGPVASVEAVKDGGIQLTFAADYPTVFDLTVNITDPGFYSTCIAEGYFILGGVSFKQVTVDFTAQQLTTADIIEEIALNSAGLSPSVIDTNAFDQLNTDQPATVSYFLDSDSSTTCADAFTALMTGVGGWWGMTSLGLLTVQIFKAPTAAGNAKLYDTHGGQMLDIDQIPLPNDIDPPPHRQRCKYARNWTVMTDLFGEVSEGDPTTANLLMNESQIASTGDAMSADVLTNYPDAPDPDPIESYFANFADAFAEANRVFTLYSSGYRLFRFRLKQSMFLHSIGDIVNVSDTRLGLTNGRYLRVVSISESTDDMTTEIQGYG